MSNQMKSEKMCLTTRWKSSLFELTVPYAHAKYLYIDIETANMENQKEWKKKLVNKKKAKTYL